MTRRQYNGRRTALEQAPRGRGGGLFMGIVIGLVAGLIVAAGIAWYLTSQPSPFKTTDQPPLIPATVPEAVPKAAAPAEVAPNPPAAATSPPVTDAPPAATPPANPAVTAPPPAKSAPPKSAQETPPPAKSDFTFFDILPGEAGKVPKQKLPREVWWLQVAALREAKDAERLKARLALLGLPVQTQKVTSGEATLHRVRVGPFKTEDEALSALDTLSENDYEPRLLKEQLSPP